MSVYYCDDYDRVKGLGRIDNDYLLSSIPRPYALYRDCNMPRWVAECPEKPPDNLIYGVIWKEKQEGQIAKTELEGENG